MDWINILTAITSILIGSGGSWLYFRPKLKEANVSADKAQFAALTERIESLTQMYNLQGQSLDDLRARLLRMGDEIQSKDERITQLAAENRALVKKVAKLEKELAAYKTLLPNEKTIA